MGGLGQYLLQLAVALGAGSIMAPIIAALFTRQRTRAEGTHLSATATSELTKAAGDVAKIYSALRADDKERSDSRIADLEGILTRRAEDIRQLEARLAIAIEMLEDAGLDPASIR